VLRIEHPDYACGTLQLGIAGGLVLLGAVEMTTAAMCGLSARGVGCVLASRSWCATQLLETRVWDSTAR
jgi:hypothetical protein